MDPNWFYSTLAQSTAAIVGLAGAFLVQRLLSQRAEIAPLREALRNRCQALVHTQIEQEVREADVVLESLDTALGQARSSRAAGGPIRVTANVTVLDPQSGASGTVGLPEPTGFDGIETLETAQSNVREYLQALGRLDWETVVEALRTRGELPPADPPWLDDPGQRPGGSSVPPGVGLWPRIEDQRFTIAHRWRRLRTLSQSYGQELASLRARLVPRSFYALLGILTALTCAGVIAPLFFLSAEEGASRPILLALFVPFAIAFVLFFGYELRQLRRADRLGPDTF